MTSHATVACLSARLAAATLLPAEIIHELTDITIDGRDAPLLWAQLGHLELVVNLLANALYEAEQYGEYRPEGRAGLKLASDSLPSDTPSALREAA